MFKKVKVFPYSLRSVWPGADPGVQAVSPQVTLSHPPGGRLPLLSARPAVTSSVAFTGWRQPGASFPMGQGDMSPIIYEGGTSMVMSPNILEVMSFRMLTRVTTRNYVHIPKESGWRICCILELEKLKVKNMFLNVYFAARFILSSNSNNCFCCILMQILCVVSQKSLSFWGTSSPWPSTGAPPLDPAGGTEAPRPPVFFYVPSTILWDRRRWRQLYTR